MRREREERKGGEGRKEASNRGREEETRDLKNNKDKIAKLKVKLIT